MIKNLFLGTSVLLNAALLVPNLTSSLSGYVKQISISAALLAPNLTSSLSEYVGQISISNILDDKTIASGYENLCLVTNFVMWKKNSLEGCEHSTALRNQYNQKITAAKIKFINDFNSHFTEKSAAEWAKEASSIRSTLKKEIQDESTLIGKIGIFFRNGFSFEGPTFESLQAKGKTMESIINSSFRTDGKDLGLEGNGSEDFLAENFFSIVEGSFDYAA